jgi:hypothetical protein
VTRSITTAGYWMAISGKRRLVPISATGGWLGRVSCSFEASRRQTALLVVQLPVTPHRIEH